MSDDEYDEWNSCKRKVRYGHKQTAKRAIESMRAKGVLNLESYECRYCSRWHIGHTLSPVVRFALKILSV